MSTTQTRAIAAATKDHEREQFSNRLRQALRQAELADDSPTVLQRNFNVRARNCITVHAARKWLLGESIPTQERIRTLALWLGVQAQWLRFGDGDDTQAVSDSQKMAPRTLRVLEGFERLVDRDQQLVQSMIENMLLESGRAPTGAPA